MELLAQRMTVTELSGANLVFMLAIFLTFLGLVLVSMGGFWLSYQKERISADLKRDLIARGYAAKEIVAVLNAGKVPEDPDEDFLDLRRPNR